AAGALTSLSGQPLQAFSPSFDSDSTNPTVVASSLNDNVTIPTGDLTYQVRFSETLATAGLGPEDAALIDAITGQPVGRRPASLTAQYYTTGAGITDFPNFDA